jgi:putative flavoprotein involved in K+ transport
VLVVGSAQSGAQIAEELYKSGRRVFLSTGSAGRVPRRYRGKDGFEWVFLSGFFDLTPDKLPVPIEHFAAPHLSGTKGGHTLNLHQFAKDGVTLLGHVRDAEGTQVRIAPDLYENLAKADGFELEMLKMVDGYIVQSGIDAPPEELPPLRDGYSQPVIEELDLKAAGINTILWATGYKPDFDFIKLPVVDRYGFPMQTRGVSNYPGLYFVGMPFMPTLKTGTLMGVGESAQWTAAHIVGHSFPAEQAPVRNAANSMA